MGDVGSARYELALLSPCLTIRVLGYSNCQRSINSISKGMFRNLALSGLTEGKANEQNGHFVNWSTAGNLTEINYDTTNYA